MAIFTQNGADATIVDFDGNYPSDYVDTDFECQPIIKEHLKKLGRSYTYYNLKMFFNILKFENFNP